MPMTVTDMAPIVGRVVLVTMEALTVRCRVVDAKTSWNRVRFAVEPLEGSGRQWVESPRIIGIEAAKELPA